MKVAITGCHGFVGRYLVEAMPDAEIIAIDRAPAPAGFPPVARTYVTDLISIADVEEIIRREQPDRLIHLASFSSVGFSWHEPITSFTNNTNIFLNVIECVRRHSPRTRVLSIGSSDQYGIVEELPLRETSRMVPQSPYAVSRVAVEHLGNVYARGYGIDLVGTRSFNHVGAGQSAQFVVSALAKQFAERAPVLRVGTTSVIRDFLDVRDVVAAYLALLDRGQRGEVYNICSGRGVSIADVIQMLGETAGYMPAIVTDPALVRPVENAVVTGDHSKITAAVGWRPAIRLEEALRSVYEAWR